MNFRPFLPLSRPHLYPKHHKSYNALSKSQNLVMFHPRGLRSNPPMLKKIKHGASCDPNNSCTTQRLCLASPISIFISTGCCINSTPGVSNNSRSSVNLEFVPALHPCLIPVFTSIKSRRETSIAIIDFLIGAPQAYLAHPDQATQL